MTTKQKRIIEIFIVSTVLVIVLMHYMQKRQNALALEQYQKEYTAYNQLLFDLYGPGKRGPYCDFITDKYGRSGLGQFAAAYQWFPGVNGILFTEHAPLIKGVSPMVEVLASDLHAVLANGANLLSPEEKGFASIKDATRAYTTWPAKDISYMILQSAYRDWLDQNCKKSVDKIADVFRFGRAIEPAALFGESTFAQEIQSRAINSFETLLWLNPTPDQTKKVNEFLDTLKPETWSLPDSCFDFVNMYYEDLNMIGLVGIHKNTLRIPMQIFALLPVADSNKQTPVQRWNLAPSKPWGMKDVITYTQQWTTIPAFYKRVRAYPDDQIKVENSAYAAKMAGFPKEIRLLSANSPTMYQTLKIAAGGRFNQLVKKATLVKAAFWARQFRDQNGRWPSSGEFEQQSPGKDTLKLISEVPTSIVSIYMRTRLNTKRYENYRGYNGSPNAFEYRTAENGSLQLQVKPQHFNVINAPVFYAYNGFGSMKKEERGDVSMDLIDYCLWINEFMSVLSVDR